MKLKIIIVTILLTAFSFGAELTTRWTADEALSAVYYPSNGVPNYKVYTTNIWISGNLTNILWKEVAHNYTAAEALSRVLVPVDLGEGVTGMAMSVNISETSLTGTLDDVYLNKSADTAGTLTVTNLTAVNAINNYINSNFKAGYYAGYLANGDNNSYLGCYAGQLASGDNNSCLGNRAGGSASGNDNIYIGGKAGYDANLYRSVCLGGNAGYNAQGQSNTFIGFRAGINYAGNRGLIIGFHAGTGGSGSMNGMVGRGAGYAMHGDLNFAIGHHAGYFTFATNCLFLGQLAGREGAQTTDYRYMTNAVYFGNYERIFCNTARVEEIGIAINPHDAVRLETIQSMTNGTLSTANAYTDSATNSCLQVSNQVTVASNQGYFYSPDTTGTNGYFTTEIYPSVISNADGRIWYDYISLTNKLKEDGIY